jgi:hypothetical protein
MFETGYVNPFLSSFVVPNPTVPPEQVKKDDGPDPLLEKLNAGESYSVYKCRKPWTLAVAVFQSPTIVQTADSDNFIGKLMGDSSADRLSAAALNAHNLAELIRTQWKLEAYVFHTRYNSVVAIGGYDRKDDPQLLQMEAKFRFHVRDQVAAQVFLSNPLPMEVPKTR